MVDQQLLHKLANGVAHGEYSLLLGAGASLGARGGNGRPLPSGPGLREALVADFKIDSGGETISLARAYEHARRQNAALLRSYLRAWFTGCKPTWQGMLSEFSWHRIWTLNIDDVLETAFNERGRPYVSFGWREHFSDHDVAHQEQVVYLHGIAARLSETREDDNTLVFSLTEYARSVADPQSWHQVFFDEFAERPFIIIGASLTEEFDLVEALSRGTVAQAQTGYPSVVVVPSLTPLQQEELETMGLLVVHADGEAFIRALLDRYRAALNELKDVYGHTVSPDVARFLQQFIDLRSHTPRTSEGSRVFYAGYKPTWETITSNDDAKLEITERASRAACEAAMGDDVVQEIHFLHGHPGTGKSTALLRIAKDLTGVGARPFLFRTDEDLDVDATFRWLQLVPRTVLLIDDCADFSRTMEQLAVRCQQDNVRMIAIATERTKRVRLVNDRISFGFLRPDPPHRCGQLSDADIESLIAKLYSRGRLGRITRLSREEQRAYFVGTAGRRLFDAMAELEGASGFRRTVRRSYEALRDERVKTLCAAASISYELGIALPTGIGAVVAGIPAKDLQRLIEGEAGDLLLLTASGLRPPHRITASMVVQDVLSPHERFPLTLSLAKALAPHMDRQAIATMTRSYRLARQLMDQETVTRYVGPNRARDWFDQLRDEYSWNGRYWEQRALLESHLGDDRTARSYAERAIQVHAHPFAFNTLGTILLRIAIDTEDIQLLKSGVETLERARETREWDPSAHPYVTFFTSMIRFGTTWGIGAIPQNIRNKWPIWFRHASAAPPFSHRDRYAELEGWQRDWLMLATSGS